MDRDPVTPLLMEWTLEYSYQGEFRFLTPLAAADAEETKMEPVGDSILREPLRGRIN